MKHYATAIWHGSGKYGNGEITTESYSMDRTYYSFESRFADGNGTNPEELLAAAHASCFNMKLSFVLGEAGYVPVSLETTCHINFEKGFINGSHLSIKANVPGINEQLFNACIKETNECSPISNALKIKITLETFLNKL